ncbi:MAG: hypothetical protein II500_04075 [Campylobacter sp.]|nr:hypothetical protein [Campylobacter sp.]
MKKIILILIFFEIAFGKININDADRYELMTIGKLDAGRADMLINYRKNKEITDKNQLKLITGFNGYDTSILEENFEIKEKEKPVVKEEPKEEPKTIIQPVQVVEKTRIIHAPPRYRRESTYGDITITETGSLRPPYRNSHRIPNHRYDSHYRIPQRNSDCFRNGSNVCISGEIEFGFQKRW